MIERANRLDLCEHGFLQEWDTGFERRIDDCLWGSCLRHEATARK